MVGAGIHKSNQGNNFMINIDLIYLGNEKEKAYNDASDEYIKRLSAFCSFKQKNIKDEKLPSDPSESEIRAALDKEAKKISAELPERNYKIALCIEGRQFSSEEFADMIDSVASKGYSGISFVIGSSHGLADSVKNMCDLKMSVSKMTFPHKLFRVMILEQIYRAFSINNGSKYHK